MRSNEQKEARIRLVNILCLSILLFAGLALIAYSLIAQDRALLQDMEEYTTLVELVQNTEQDEPETNFETSEEISETVIPWDPDVPTNIPSPIAEIEDAVKESADQSVNQTGSQETEQAASSGIDQDVLIVVIPGDIVEMEPADRSEQPTSNQTQEKTRQTVTTKPAENESGKQEANSNQPKETTQSQPMDKAVSSPEITQPSQESPSISPVMGNTAVPI